jgi:hypothetical protein
MAGESELMWVRVDSCDVEAGVLFGRLDNEPLLDKALHMGDELAGCYEKVVEHGKESDFQKQ